MCNVYRRSKIGILCNINRRRRCLFVFWHFSCSCGKRFTLDFKGAKAFCDIFRRSSCLFLMALFLLLRKTLPHFIIHWLHVTERERKIILQGLRVGPAKTMASYVFVRHHGLSTQAARTKIEEKNLRELGHTKLVKKVSWSRGV